MSARGPARTGQAAEQNRVLLALPPDEYAWISAWLEPVETAQGQVLAEAKEPIRHVDFPETAVCSVVRVFGNDGADERPVLRRMLRRYTRVFLAQVAQSAACNRAHVLEQRCSRWLLMTHDRAGRDPFPLAHEFLAVMPGCAAAPSIPGANARELAGSTVQPSPTMAGYRHGTARPPPAAGSCDSDHVSCFMTTACAGPTLPLDFGSDDAWIASHIGRTATGAQEAASMDTSRTESARVPAARVVSGAAVVALGSALQGQLRGWLPEAELRRAIRSMCDEARRHGLRAEQLLVVYKRALVSALDACGIPAGNHRDSLSARLVSACIEEFYAAGVTA